ncbi:MAG: hypothetical protein MZW92_17425 [Comamonadaceae bacterium]|nr:hypothetical protein [Comamonadaceae bacterium]
MFWTGLAVRAARCDGPSREWGLASRRWSASLGAGCGGRCRPRRQRPNRPTCRRGAGGAAGRRRRRRTG